MATLTWNQDQQTYEAEVVDQASGYLVLVSVDGDEFAESLEEEGEPARAALLSPYTWLELAEVNDHVHVERIRELTTDELRPHTGERQPSDPQ